MVFEVTDIVADEFVEAHGCAIFEAAFDGVGFLGDVFDEAGEEFVVDAPVVEDFFPVEFGITVELHGTGLVVTGDIE